MKNCLLHQIAFLIMPSTQSFKHLFRKGPQSYFRMSPGPKEMDGSWIMAGWSRGPDDKEACPIIHHRAVPAGRITLHAQRPVCV